MIGKKETSTKGISKKIHEDMFKLKSIRELLENKNLMKKDEEWFLMKKQSL